MPSQFSAEKFQPARLIPTTGIKGAIDQERRASSALLSVMKIVPELAYSLLKPLGAPRGAIETYIEPEFKQNGRKIRPDGLISVRRGKREWLALVEVKTANNALDVTQIHQYLDICRDYKIDALLTISNEVLNASGAHPTAGIDSRKLRSTRLEHFSWLRILTESVVLADHVGLEDIERGLVLKELIRFLQSGASGASEFNDMGPAWVNVRDGIRTGVIAKPNQDVLDTVSRFESLVRYAAMRLSKQLGVSVKEVVPRSAKSDYRKHLADAAGKFVTTKTLRGVLEIPDAAAPLEITADIGSGFLRFGCSLSAPSEGRNRTRLNWMLRQIRKAPDGLSLSWVYKHSRNSEQPYRVVDLLAPDFDLEISNGREISSFRVEKIVKMGSKRAAGKGGFIDSVVEGVEDFYGQVLEVLTPWQAPAPKLPSSQQSSAVSVQETQDREQVSESGMTSHRRFF